MKLVGGIILATIGTLTILTELYLHWTNSGYELNHWALIIGVMFGFVGFFIINPKETKEATTFVTSKTTKFIPFAGGGKTPGEISTIEIEEKIKKIESAKKAEPEKKDA